MPVSSAFSPQLTAGSTATTTAQELLAAPAADAQLVEAGVAPQRPGHVLEQLAVDLLAAQAGALVDGETMSAKKAGARLARLA